MIRLRRAGGHECVGTVCESITHEEFQLARLVTAQREAGLIVALDEQFRPAELAREPGKLFNRRRELRKLEARQPFNVHSWMDSTESSTFCKSIHFTNCWTLATNFACTGNISWCFRQSPDTNRPIPANDPGCPQLSEKLSRAGIGSD